MKFSKNDLIFIPLGGSGEIGMNCNLYHYNGSWIMIDLGVMFGNSSMSPNELIMPDLSFLYENKIKLSALILTHAHEDHIGAVPYLYYQLNNVPIFTTSFTASVLKRKFMSNDVKRSSVIEIFLNIFLKKFAFPPVKTTLNLSFFSLFNLFINPSIIETYPQKKPDWIAWTVFLPTMFLVLLNLTRGSLAVIFFNEFKDRSIPGVITPPE